MDKISLFREMGLGPVWTLRRAEAAAVVSSPEAGNIIASAVTPSSSPVDIVATHTKEMPTEDVGAMDWPALRQSVAGCSACALCKGRTQAVLGVGDVNADWLFVGEGPGAEDRKSVV